MPIPRSRRSTIAMVPMESAKPMKCRLSTTGKAHSGPFIRFAQGLVVSHSKNGMVPDSVSRFGGILLIDSEIVTHRRLSLLAISLSAAAVLAGSGAGQVRPARDLAEAKPETAGFSSARLERLHAVLRKTVDERQLPGIVTAMARHGKIVDFQTYGKKDLASGAAVEKDTIFRIYSMTKPVTGVAMMILYEQGKWSPEEPIAKYIPQFAHLKVFKGLDGNGQALLEEPAHPPTMAELMSHTAGF